MRAGSKIIRHSTVYLKRIGGKEEASFEMSASIELNSKDGNHDKLENNSALIG